MARSLKISTPSVLKLVTLAEAKTHLRVDFSNDDNYINDLIDLAQELIEEYCNVAIYEQVLVQQCDTWDETFNLLRGPIIHVDSLTVSSIKYFDTNNVQQTWDSSNYDVDKNSRPPRIYPSDNTVDDFPDLADRIFPIEITYKAGLLNSQTSLTPKILKQACYLLIGQFYENRQPVIVGRSVSQIPMTVKFLLDKHKVQTFGLSEFVGI